VDVDTSDLWTCPRCGKRLVTRNMSHSCGHHTVVSLALSLTVYWPTVTVMVSGYRGVRSPDVHRAHRAATACALFLALWSVALLVLQLE
jgi:hypothetical protein